MVAFYYIVNISYKLKKSLQGAINLYSQEVGTEGLAASVGHIVREFKKGCIARPLQIATKNKNLSLSVLSVSIYFFSVRACVSLCACVRSHVPIPT